ncbi:MAG: TonB family protein [Ferrovum sp.]|uniref:energy transducer TonB n=1 Tax=Ferrovum sp. TaxID=2609467 RepID=UPI002625CFF3|nr:energy transducer TonB [Ferrovum sp.]MBW8065897.1 TonB family protein [Ferrovum sp.]
MKSGRVPGLASGISSYRSPWVAAVVVSLLIHGLLLLWIRFSGLTWRLPSPLLPMTVDLEAGPAPATIPRPPELPVSPKASPPSPVPQKVSAPSSSPEPASPDVPATPDHTQTASKPADLVPQSAAGFPDASSNSLVWRSLSMAHGLVQDPWAGKRVRTLDSGTREGEWQAYEEAFTTKVAEVGGLNYPPPEQGQPLSGSVGVETVLNADGTVASVDIRRSSGHSALDQAALRIVRMAAPFQPFTATMRAQTDLIRITRTFNFVRAGEPLRSQ